MPFPAKSFWVLVKLVNLRNSSCSNSLTGSIPLSIGVSAKVWNLQLQFNLPSIWSHSRNLGNMISLFFGLSLTIISYWSGIPSSLETVLDWLGLCWIQMIYLVEFSSLGKTAGFRIACYEMNLPWLTHSISWEAFIGNWRIYTSQFLNQLDGPHSEFLGTDIIGLALFEQQIIFRVRLLHLWETVALWLIPACAEFNIYLVEFPSFLQTVDLELFSCRDE
jgi:hypothetical protein